MTALDWLALMLIVTIAALIVLAALINRAAPRPAHRRPPPQRTPSPPSRSTVENELTGWGPGPIGGGARSCVGGVMAYLGVHEPSRCCQSTCPLGLT